MYLNRIYVIIAAVGLCFVTGSALSAAEKPKTSISGGSMALQFSVAGDLFNLDFNALQGSVISLKYHLSDLNAIRFGVSFDGTFEDYAYDRTHLTDETRKEEQDDDVTFGLRLQFLHHFLRPDRPVAGYVGIGPKFDYYYSQHLEQFFPTGIIEYETRATTVGGTALIGIEWFPVHYASLLLEYSVDAEYYWDEVTSLTGSPLDGSHIHTSQKLNHYRVSANAVQLGLSVYFL